ncbi:cadherin-like domain-containing protein [Xanthobacter sp. V3C-3]|uniref:cadherin-like domain-containing protein n=1 Tax=Xanthobacter lutulentifluminis TaxID=3119935 RepID=UPI003729AA5A
MITVKGTRMGQRPGAPAADLYRTQEERPAARLVALVGAGIAGAVAYFASGATSAAAAETPPPPKPQDAAQEEAPPSPGELPRAASAAAADPDAEEAKDRAEAPPPPATEVAEFMDAPPELALAARLARLGPPSRATAEDPQAGIAMTDDPVGAARIRPPHKARPSATGNDDEEERPSGSGEEPSEGEGSGEDDDETTRNRAPRAGDPVSLPAVMATQAVFIPVASLLAGASDPDGEALQVTSITASAGLLLPVEGGWVYLAPPLATEDVALSYTISDGLDGVPQRAVFDVTPEGAVAAGTAAPEMFAALSASARQAATPVEEDAAAPAMRHLVERTGVEDGPAAPAEAAAESPPADSTAATDAAGTTPAAAPPASTLDPATASTVASGSDVAATEPAGGSLAALAAPVPGVPEPAAVAPPAAEPAAPVAVAAAASPESASASFAAATETDAFAFAPEPSAAQGETVSQIVALEVGDRVDMAAAAPQPDADSQFAAAYGDGAGALPYQIHADASVPATVPDLPEPFDPDADAAMAQAAAPEPLFNA